MTTEIIATLARLVCGTSVRWAGCAPDARQRIYFANHTSNLDALVLWAALPAEVRAFTRPVGAQDYWTTNRLRLYLAARVFNAILIERKKVTVSNNPVEKMLASLGDQFSLIIFPEGGRNPDSEPRPFKAGLFHLARHRPDIELVPVWIENLNRILPMGETLPVPLLSGITFGEPMKLGAEESKAAFLDRARLAVLALRIS